MLISPALAQSGGFAEGGLGLMPIILVMIIFYFLLIRPQQKRAKQHKAMLAELKRGDKIITNGGLTGTIVKVVDCLLYTSPSPRDFEASRMPSSA